MKPVFCEITEWWNWYYLKSQISAHFFYYPVQLMIEKGFNVEVLSMLHPERKETEFEYLNNLHVHRFARDESALPFDVKFFSFMAKRNYSLIHLHSVDWLFDHIPWIVSKIKNTPMVFTTHSHDTLKALMNPEVEMSFMEKIELRNMLLLRDSPRCVLIAFTKYQAESYAKLGIKNVRVIPHGVDLAPFKVEPDDNIKEKYGLGEHNILCVGTMEPRKGQLLLIKSMPQILKEFPNTRLILIGRAYFDYQFRYLNDLKSFVNKMDLKEKVLFLDDVSRGELIQLYKLSSVFALPTEAEMFGIVFLEAMAAGLPIVTTDRPHIREVLANGEAGILLQREQQLIEAAILRLLNDAAIRKRLGGNGKKIVEQKYRIDLVVQQHWNLYQSLLCN